MGLLNRLRALAVLALIAVSVSACGYNVIPTKQEAANAAWAEVQNQYQRRADLVPNLVATVQGFAKQEKDVFVQVTEARAKATSIHLDANDLTDPAKVKAAAGCAKRAVGRPRATARGQRKLSGAQIERELPRAAIPARGDGKPDRRRPARLHRLGAGLQHDAADLPKRALGADGVPLDQAAGSVHRRFRRPGGAEGEVLARQRESLHAAPSAAGVVRLAAGAASSRCSRPCGPAWRSRRPTFPR